MQILCFEIWSFETSQNRNTRLSFPKTTKKNFKLIMYVWIILFASHTLVQLIQFFIQSKFSIVYYLSIYFFLIFVCIFFIKTNWKFFMSRNEFTVIFQHAFLSFGKMIWSIFDYSAFFRIVIWFLWYMIHSIKCSYLFM